MLAKAILNSKCVCVCVSLVDARVFVCVWHVCAYMCVCLSMHGCACVCVCVFMHACMCVCECVCMLEMAGDFHLLRLCYISTFLILPVLGM